MKLKDLIEELQEAYKEYGDIDVAVQYRDDGGDYCGVDNAIYCYVKNIKDYDKNDNEVIRKTLIL